MSDLNSITGTIIGASYRISNQLGLGLKESVYEMVLARDLGRSGMQAERQKLVSFDFEGLWFENAYAIDLLVEGVVAVELKSAINVGPRDKKQLLTYLRLAQLPLGLLINFGEANLKHGIFRVINTMPSPAQR